MKEIIVKFILIMIIIVSNLFLAYLGSIYHLIYLAGVCLMLVMWKMIRELLK